MQDDKWIALAALAVTALVGVGTPIATNMHDSNRLRREQAQADRTELRTVIDTAAAALFDLRAGLEATRDQLYGRTIFFDGTPAARDEVPPGRPHSIISASALGTLRRQVDGVRDTHVRVAIRLGAHADATEYLAAADVAATTLYVTLRFERKTGLSADRRLDQTFRRAFHEYFTRTDQFVVAGNRLARSITH